MARKQPPKSKTPRANQTIAMDAEDNAKEVVDEEAATKDTADKADT